MSDSAERVAPAPRSALVIKPSSMGDIVHTLPAVACIKRSFPGLQLRWLCNEEWTPLLEGNPDLAGVIPFPRGRFRGLAGLPALVRWIGSFNRQPRELPEIALDFQGLLRSGLLGVFRGARPVVGLSDSREGARFLHEQVVKVEPGLHAVDRYLRLARHLGATVDPENLSWPLPAGAPPDRALPERFIVVHPYARGRGKSLGGEALQALCDTLAPHAVVLAGRAAAIEPVRGAHLIDLLNGTSIAQLIWLLRRASAIISVDSGPMHIAAALQPARTVSIHTWSDPRLVGPYDLRARVWKAGRIASRDQFDGAEAAAESAFGVGDARRLADFVLRKAVN